MFCFPLHLNTPRVNPLLLIMVFVHIPIDLASFFGVTLFIHLQSLLASIFVAFLRNNLLFVGIEML
jgi:hypothetical protein